MNHEEHAIKSYGRSLLSYTANELELRNDPNIDCQDQYIPFPELDGHIYYQTWSPKQKSNSQFPVDVLFCHGYCEYSGRVAKIIKPLIEAGYNIIAPDLPGFGRSSGLFGFISDANIFPVVLNRCYSHYLDQLKEKKENRRLYAVGFSLGGWTSLQYSLNYPVSGMVLLGPMLGIANEAQPPSWVPKLAEKCLPTMCETLPLLPSCMQLAQVESKLHEIINDEHMYLGRLRLGTGLQLFKACEKAQAEAEKVTSPMLIIHGENDRLCPLYCSKNFIQNAKNCKDKEIYVQKGLEHDFILEDNASSYFDMAAQWIAKHEKALENE